MKSYVKIYPPISWLIEVIRKSFVNHESLLNIFPEHLFGKKLYVNFLCINYKVSKLENCAWKKFSENET